VFLSATLTSTPFELVTSKGESPSLRGDPLFNGRLKCDVFPEIVNLLFADGCGVRDANSDLFSIIFLTQKGFADHFWREIFKKYSTLTAVTLGGWK